MSYENSTESFILSSMKEALECPHIGVPGFRVNDLNKWENTHSLSLSESTFIIDWRVSVIEFSVKFCILPKSAPSLGSVRILKSNNTSGTFPLTWQYPDMSGFNHPSLFVIFSLTQVEVGILGH